SPSWRTCSAPGVPASARRRSSRWRSSAPWSRIGSSCSKCGSDSSARPATRAQFRHADIARVPKQYRQPQPFVASGGPRLVWLHETERQASDWHRSGRDSGELLRGRALSHAQQWVADREESVPPLVREFVAAGAARNRRDRRIRRGVVAALSVVVIAAVMFGILARYQAAVSEAERASAASHSLSALSLS